jgi:hypothetical protein
MRRLIFLSVLLGLYAGTTIAQVHKKKPGTNASGKKAAGQPGSLLQFNDLLLITERPEMRTALLKQKHFALELPQERETYPITDIFHNLSGEEVKVSYDPAKDARPVVIFRTSSWKRGQRLLTDARKNSFSAIDSTETVTGNDQESFLIHKVRYSRQWSPTMPPPYPDAFIPLITTSEEYTKTGKIYIFSFSGITQNVVVESSPIDRGDPLAMAPDLAQSDSEPVDTLFIDPGKPVLLFAEIGPRREKGNKDSIGFFRKRDFFYGSFLRLTKAYPPDQYRYINLYRPTVVRYGNHKSDILHFQSNKNASGFVYWGGKNTDPIIKHNDWQDALYIANNASGNNKLKPGYQKFRSDSLEVARISGYPASTPSSQLLQHMNYFIVSGLWHEGLLPLPSLDMKQVRNISAANKEGMVQYHFNRQEQLDSLTDETTNDIGVITKRVLYKNGIPVAACINKDTSRFSYAGDTLIVLRSGYILRYLLKDKVLLLIDNFKIDSDDYLRNNIRDRINDLDHVPLEPLYEKDAEGNLVLDENNLFLKASQKGYGNVQARYIFRKGMLQRIELNNARQNISDQYYVFIRKYD